MAKSDFSVVDIQYNIDKNVYEITLEEDATMFSGQTYTYHASISPIDKVNKAYPWPFFDDPDLIDQLEEAFKRFERGESIRSWKYNPPRAKSQCECGAHKTYGEDAATWLHSRWCKLFSP